MNMFLGSGRILKHLSPIPQLLAVSVKTLTLQSCAKELCDYQCFKICHVVLSVFIDRSVSYSVGKTTRKSV